MIIRSLLFLSALIVSFLLTFPLLRILKFFHLAQAIREEGPQSHKAKAGTPTMGGLGIILTIILFALVFIDFDLDPRYLGLILLILGFALIGFLDDLLKIYRRQNLGLTFWQKIISQTAAAALFSLFLINIGHHQTITGLLRNLGFNWSVVYGLLSIVMIVGTANAANLTDGLNGLLAGTAGIAFLAFAFVSLRLGLASALAFSVFSAGATLAFLCFNFPKAKVFMGDVGSLALGAALAGLAVIIHKELALAVIGGVFLIEALSVILQVGYYKLYQRRLFRMTPLHHHFELLGWGETSVVLFFWAAAVICGLLGILI